VERPSFKKLLPKNHRHVLMRETPKLDFLEDNNAIHWKKKSIKSYF
jgi:hypothetical protein